MTEPRDDIDGWLEEPIKPLPPRPGTYEKVRRQARRRKRNKALAAAATAAAVLAGVVAIPRLTALLPGQPNSVLESGGLQSASPSRASPRNVLSARPTETGTGMPVPNGFAAMSATFVGLRTGWTLGVSTAQDGTSTAQCRTATATAGCLRLARTDNAGASWYGVPAPPTGPASDGAGVSQVRFLDRDVGWVFGPELWWTRDGGQQWQQVDTGGEHVISLEAVRDRAFAVFARCAPGATPTPAGSSAGCYAYQLYSAAARTGTWRPVPGATSGIGGSAAVVLARDTGYLVASSTGTERLSRGPVDSAAAWSTVTAPCPVGQARLPSGTPYQGTLLATTATGRLFAVCNAGVESSAGSTGTGPAAQAKEILTSTDAGRTWTRRALADIAGTALSAAATPDGGSVFIATAKGLYGSADSGNSWRLIVTGPPGGLSYVGMTDNEQGFAIPAAQGHYGILFTMDGGQSWRRSMVSGPG